MIKQSIHQKDIIKCIWTWTHKIASKSIKQKWKVLKGETNKSKIKVADISPSE